MDINTVKHVQFSQSSEVILRIPKVDIMNKYQNRFMYRMSAGRLVCEAINP